jgi:hypothetical protein
MKHFDLENNDKIMTGFKTPDHYFENFEAKMMQQISTEKPVEKEVKVVSLFYKKQIWMSSIAALLLVAIAIPVYFNLKNESNLDNLTIESYLVLQNVGTSEITKHLTDDDIIELESSLQISSSENDEIENYLLETDNLESLLNE